MAIPATGDYGSPEGVVFGYPVTIAEGRVRVVPDLALTDFDRARIRLTGAELLEERYHYLIRDRMFNKGV
jgi:malate dehydrogenase